MAPIKLYTHDASPVCRAVYAIGEALGITFEKYNVDFLKGDQFKPEFIKLNTLHTIPTLDDNGFIICDSHVMAGYLVDKYSKDDSLFPKDLEKRVLVNQKLAYDLGLLHPTLREIDDAVLFKEVSAATPKMVEKVQNLYNFLEMMLENRQWLALDNVTIADFSCYTTVTSLDYHVPIDFKTYPNIGNWIKQCKNLSYFANDSKMLQCFIDMMDTAKM